VTAVEARTAGLAAGRAAAKRAAADGTIYDHPAYKSAYAEQEAATCAFHGKKDAWDSVNAAKASADSAQRERERERERQAHEAAIDRRDPLAIRSAQMSRTFGVRGRELAERADRAMAGAR
jgi:hypothetical protein